MRALILDEDAGERLLEPFAAAAERVPVTGAGEALVAVGAATVLASTGAGGDPSALLTEWGDAMVEAGFEDYRRTAFALACVAHGSDRALHAVAGEPLRFVPDDDFGPDTLSFARYVAAAAELRADGEDVAGAWTSFVAWFPTRLQTRGLDWPELLHGGYAVYTRIAGYEPHEVLEAIREFVREVAE